LEASATTSKVLWRRHQVRVVADGAVDVPVGRVRLEDHGGVGVTQFDHRPVIFVLYKNALFVTILQVYLCQAMSNLCG